MMDMLFCWHPNGGDGFSRLMIRRRIWSSLITQSLIRFKIGGNFHFLWREIFVFLRFSVQWSGQKSRCSASICATTSPTNKRQTKGKRHLKGCKILKRSTIKSAKKLGKRIAFNSFSLISRHQWKQGWVNEKYQRWSCREDARCYCIWKLTKTIEWEFYLREWIWKEGRRRRCGGKLRHLLQRSLHLPPDLHFSSTCRL